MPVDRQHNDLLLVYVSMLSNKSGSSTVQHIIVCHVTITIDLNNCVSVNVGHELRHKMRHFVEGSHACSYELFALRSELQLWPTINFRTALPIAALNNVQQIHNCKISVLMST